MLKSINILLLLIHAHFSFAQINDSLSIQLTSQASTTSTTDYQPFWHTTNHWRGIPEQGTYLLFSASLSHHMLWGENWRACYGGQLISTPSQQTWQIAQAYASIAYQELQFSVGRFRQLWGDTDSLLSSGSLGISSNALPVPALEVSLNDYVSVPFTRDWVKLKGKWQHGWLGQDRFVKGAFLHAKNLYLQIGNKNVAFQAGLNHFAQWGGVHPKGQLPNRFQDYTRIVLGASQKNDNKFADAPQNINNALGNHRLITDLAIQGKLKNTNCKLYTQTPFETGRNETGQKRDNIDGLYILGKDRLLGAVIEQSSLKFINHLLVEYLYTRYQGGEGKFIGQFNYYNHSIYRSGWTYNGYSMGTPLFLTQAQASLYLPEGMGMGNTAFVSNRVQSLHLGLAGTPGSRWYYRSLLTYISHLGTYYNQEAFPQARKQVYALTEWKYTASPAWKINASMATDIGNLSINIGLSLGIQWQYSASVWKA